MQRKRTHKRTQKPIARKELSPDLEKFAGMFADYLPSLAQLLFNVGISASIRATRGNYGKEWDVAPRIRERLQAVVEKEFSVTNHSFPEAVGLLLFAAQFLRESKLPPSKRVN